MQITAIKTAKITPGASSLLEILDASLSGVPEGSVLAITSKIVSLCEGSVIPFGEVDKKALIIQESDRYLPAALSKYQYSFSIVNDMLIQEAGIDESNGDEHYVLWPEDAQKTANDVRAYLQKRFGLQQVGVVITDSTCQPLRRGSVGVALAHSGFLSLNSYVGKPDLFGRPFAVSQTNVSGGLAGAAVLVMGEGSEQTPLCVLSDVSFVQFQDRDPNPEELNSQRISIKDDLFAPFLESVEWQPGQRQSNA